MDKIDNDVHTIVADEVRAYATDAFKGKLYFNQSDDDLFSVIFVPDDDYPVEINTDIIIAARLVDGYILIERDDTDRPLYKELMRRGIPREQIILRYAGEKLPHAK